MSRAQRYSGPLPPAAFNMAAYTIGRAASAHPEKPALLVVADAARPPSEVWTFAAIEDAVLRIAGGLRDLGLSAGSRILIRLDNTSAYPLLFFGAIAGGFVPVPASSQLTGREAAYLLEDSGAEAVAIATHLALDAIPASVRVLEASEIAAMASGGTRCAYAHSRADDPAFLIYTSGTTSRPKGVLHGHRAAWGRRPMYQGWYGIEPGDRLLHAGSFNWTYTMGTGLTDPWANGATAIVYTGAKDPALWPTLIDRMAATMFAGTPSLYRQILKYGDLAPGRLSSLRHGLIAGETPPAGLFEEWAGRSGTHLYEALGMSELSTYISCAPSIRRRSGAVGKPQAGRCIAILATDGGDEPLEAGAEGLLAAHRSDPGLMIGYWNRPDEEAQVFRGDWFIGGDLASMDEDGYVSHRGRANDIMKALGYRVAPQEVEAALNEHPDIAEVACAEVRVHDGISVIGAFVVLKEAVRADAEAIKRYAAERLAAYKCPREVVFVDALPRTANGKLKRSDLRLHS